MKKKEKDAILKIAGQFSIDKSRTPEILEDLPFSSRKRMIERQIESQVNKEHYFEDFAIQAATKRTENFLIEKGSGLSIPREFIDLRFTALVDLKNSNLSELISQCDEGEISSFLNSRLEMIEDLVNDSLEILNCDLISQESVRLYSIENSLKNWESSVENYALEQMGQMKLLFQDFNQTTNAHAKLKFDNESDLYYISYISI